MEENQLEIKNEAGEYLLVVDQDGQVFLEGNLVGTSEKLLNQLIKYKESLTNITGALESMADLAKRWKK